MKTIQLHLLGAFGVALLFNVACDPKVQNLGKESTSNEGGSGGNGGDGGDGGQSESVKGGTSSKTTTTAKGGTGGTGGTGGETSKPITTATGYPEVFPPLNLAYPLSPTLPVDPACKCESASQICNASGRCVDRCDSEGHCAKWLINGNVYDLLVDGNTLYVATNATTDDLGNPRTNGSLYRVSYPDGAPELITEGFARPTILGRNKGKTFISSNNGSVASVVAIADEGGAPMKTACESNGSTGEFYAAQRGKWLACPTLDGQQLLLMDTDVSLTESKVIADFTVTNQSKGLGERETIDQTFLLDSYLLYSQRAGVGGGSVYHWVNLADMSQETVTGFVLIQSEFATNGTQTYKCSYNSTCVVDLPRGDCKLFLYRASALSSDLSNEEFSSGGVYGNGWLYSFVAPARTGGSRLVRYPTTVGRLPQEVLSRGFLDHYDTLRGLRVGASGLFWAGGSGDTTRGTYIFHSSLPPQPCDAELPCADSNQTCKDGYCVAK